MIMKMYDTSSSNNVIGKVLENEQTYDIKFKGSTDITNPVVVLKSDEVILSNYAYIPNFNRYYFVEKIELFPNGIYNVTMRCDVLESYKADILASKGYVNQQTEVNKYYNSDYQSEVRKELDIYESDVSITPNSDIVLVTIGGAN